MCVCTGFRSGSGVTDLAQKIAQGPGARAHLGASVLDQVYKNAARPAQPAVEAARATSGEVLTWGAAPIAAYFTASCGGTSESAEAAVLDLGATKHEHQPGTTFRVFLDPAGHPFCLCVN